ncbi:hypothetical protein E3O06_03365 [Cryobacterium glaciale]|uniref:Uncharacterized protein n=1 Tax=Cryobacterium glaciale TaxID=1259145 RepID=A0A4R8V5P8_9MICO|nr:right-handed parallel beta-helix repeat-containing protein [Cryobacterium glaciale]TFB76412.1 hypothetical protein E3O06_03365 [Cryobacterium glaciale]
MSTLQSGSAATDSILTRVSRRAFLTAAVGTSIGVIGMTAADWSHPGAAVGAAGRQPGPGPDSAVNIPGLGVMRNTRDGFRLLYPSGLRTLYVSGVGSDLNDGVSNSTPVRSLQRGISLARPGDRIRVGEGTYDHALFYDVHGSDLAWITIENAPGTTPVIDVSQSTTSDDASKFNDGIDIQRSSYIAIFGLEIRGAQTSADTNPSGVAIFRSSCHIAVWECHIHDFPGGGVNCFYTAPTRWGAAVLPGGGWDAVDIFFNTIHATSKYSPYNTSGISFYGAENLTATERYGYRAVGNYIYDVICTVPYSPGGFDFVTDGNGISPDSLAIPNSLHPFLRPYLKRGLIEGNVITACGGRGVHIFNTKNVDVVNNTLIGNLRTVSPAISGSTEVDVRLSIADPNNGVTIVNNIFAPLNSKMAFDRTAQTIRANTAVGGQDRVPIGNQDLRALGLRLFAQVPTEAAMVAGMNLKGLHPTVATWVPRAAGTLGVQALGAGLQTGASVTIGALPPVSP